MKKVRIFIDHANFDIAWKGEWGKQGPHIAWDRLPGLIMEKLQERKFIRPDDAELRGISVYASTHPFPTDKDRSREHWLKFGLDQLPGYTVRTAVRQRQPCDHGIHDAHYVEKGVDTMIVCDMLSFAMRDFYDVGVIISDDSDLVPSVESVQSVLDRQIVHAGFRSSGQAIRSAAWGHLLLDEIKADLAEARKQKPAPKPAPAAAAAAEPVTPFTRDLESQLEASQTAAIPLKQ
jgi:uncharacterized LabA/DUF88 family protein